jgi:hypothetical protein
MGKSVLGALAYVFLCLASWNAVAKSNLDSDVVNCLKLPRDPATPFAANDQTQLGSIDAKLAWRTCWLHNPQCRGIGETTRREPDARNDEMSARFKELGKRFKNRSPDNGGPSAWDVRPEDTWGLSNPGVLSKCEQPIAAGGNHGEIYQPSFLKDVGVGLGFEQRAIWDVLHLKKLERDGWSMIKSYKCHISDGTCIETLTDAIPTFPGKVYYLMGEVARLEFSVHVTDSKRRDYREPLDDLYNEMRSALKEEFGYPEKIDKGILVGALSWATGSKVERWQKKGTIVWLSAIHLGSDHSFEVAFETEKWFEYRKKKEYGFFDSLL